MIATAGTEGRPLSNGEKATAITAGGSHTCAILADKSVKCWGANDYGQIGGGTQNEGRTLILSGTEGKPLSDGEKATVITAGRWHTCAILTDKSVKCWGANDYGQIGGGTQNEGRTLILSGTEGKPLSDGEKATYIAAGYNRTCAILADQSR